MDQRAIEDLIFELLAEESGMDPIALRRELEEAGQEMPIDSLLAVEVVAAVEERCGVQLPVTAETARNLRSVQNFAAMVRRLMQERSQAVGEGA
jgi:acyl carrier protein